jgi:hypothetical protein
VSGDKYKTIGGWREANRTTSSFGHPGGIAAAAGRGLAWMGEGSRETGPESRSFPTATVTAAAGRVQDRV